MSPKTQVKEPASKPRGRKGNAAEEPGGQAPDTSTGPASQPLLLRPAEPPKADSRGDMSPELIQHEECFVTDELMSSIQAFGVIEPVILVGGGMGRKHTIVEGRRRVKAALTLKLDEIPFIHFASPSDAQGYIMHLSGHYLRSDNLYAEIESLERLTARHASEVDIAKAIGGPIKKVHKRLRLLKLHQVLRHALLDNTVDAQLALKLCTWTDSEQEQAVAIYRRLGKLKWTDVNHIRPSKARGGAAQEPLPELTPFEQHGLEFLRGLEGLRDGSSNASIRISNLYRSIGSFVSDLEVDLPKEKAHELAIAWDEFREVLAV